MKKKYQENNESNSDCFFACSMEIDNHLKAIKCLCGDGDENREFCMK